jgi:putative transposase
VGTPGRRKRLDVRKLIVRIASATGWGYTRVLGELRKLTSQKISRQFVVNVMKEHGFEPGPKRGEKTWHEFITMHADSLWQADFFSNKVFTLNGWREYFMIAFLHVGSRRVFVTPATDHPTAEWVAEQAKAFRQHSQENGLEARFLYHDRDGKFGAAFDQPFATNGIEVRRTSIRAPNMQAHVERWIQSIRTECLDQFVVLGERHLNYLVSTYVAYYHEHRPHQGLGNVRLIETGEADADVPRPHELRCQQWLGGHLKSYRRKAA